MLYYEGALESSSCGTPALDDTGAACAARMESQCCDRAAALVHIDHLVALFAADGAMLAYGELGDRLGPRACFGTGAGLAWLGLLLLGLGAKTGSDLLWLASLLCIGVSGPGVFMGCLFLGERYPRLHAVISAVGAAMWDASALVFRLFAMLYFASVPGGAKSGGGGDKPSIGLDTIAFGWLLLVVPLGLLTFRALPSKQLLDRLRAEGGEASSQPLTQADEAGGTSKPSPKAEEPPSLAGASFLSVFCRNDTRLMLCFMGLFNLKSSFYIATLRRSDARDVLTSHSRLPR